MNRTVFLLFVFLIIGFVIIFPFYSPSLPEKSILPEEKIYAVENQIILCMSEAPWYKVYDAYLLTSDGQKWKCNSDTWAFWLQHKEYNISIYRWSGSCFLDLVRRWYIDFKDDNGNIVSTFGHIRK